MRESEFSVLISPIFLCTVIPYFLSGKIGIVIVFLLSIPPCFFCFLLLSLYVLVNKFYYKVLIYNVIYIATLLILFTPV